MALDGTEYDAIVVGGGFGGTFHLKHLRELGFNVHMFEAGSQLGGVWYWYVNRTVEPQFETFCAYTIRFLGTATLAQEWTPNALCTSSPTWKYLRTGNGRRDIQDGTSYVGTSTTLTKCGT